MRTAVELAIGLRALPRSFWIGVTGPARVHGDSLGVLQLTAVHSSALKKKHVAVSWGIIREQVALENAMLVKIDTHANPSDVGTKPLGPAPFHSLIRALFNTQVWVADWIKDDFQGHGREKERSEGHEAWQGDGEETPTGRAA